MMSQLPSPVASTGRAGMRAVTALAEAFGLELVAEGVESAAAARTLLEHGCHSDTGVRSRTAARDG